MISDSLIYTGRIGDTYAFYTVATDWVGNREEVPLVADATVTPSISTGIHHHNGSGLTVYPNPFTETLTLHINQSSSSSFHIIDLLGKTVYSGTLNGNSLSLNLCNLDAGTYFLHLLNGSESEIMRIVKQ